MHILDGQKLDFDDVLIVPQRSTTASRSQVIVEREFRTYIRHGVINGRTGTTTKGLPIVVANMLTGTFEMAKAMTKLGAYTALHKYHKEEDLFNFFLKEDASHTFYTLGINDDFQFRKLYERLAKEGKEMYLICIDIANGYMDSFIDSIQEIRCTAPDAIIMAGNVCTPNMTEELIQNGGVNIVKVGIGPGSHCTTRRVAGVGYPQLSAIMECANAAHGLGAHICADGGCRTPGDVCKALGAGADFVMLGTMFAGTDECEGEWTYEYEYIMSDGKSIWHWSKDGVGAVSKATGRIRKYQHKFYGMASKEAADNFGDGLKDYRASEGTTTLVPYKGPSENVLKEVLGGIRSCAAYIGASSVKDIPKRTTFVVKK